jgi:hypothetical protein
MGLLNKPFDPIGLGNLLDVIFLDDHEDGIDWHLPTEKHAAPPFKGKAWIAAEVVFGHFNGPKKKIGIITDGEEVLKIKGTYKLTLRNKDQHKADPVLKKFVLEQIGERLF